MHTLRLRNPVAVEDAGSARLVDILEWATQVARLWRQTGGPRVQELLEEVSPGSESVKLGQTYGRLRYSVAPSTTVSMPATPAASASNVSISAVLATHASSSRRRLSMRSFRSRTESSVTLRPPEPAQRPFDAIFHFIPADITEKAMLKSAILVTSLSRPYLSIAPARAPATRFWSEAPKSQKPTNGRRLSFFRSGSATSSSTTISVDPKLEQLRSSSRSPTKLSEDFGRPSAAVLARCRKPRLIHIMPSLPAKAGQIPSQAAAAQGRHVRSIEAFLLSFSFSLPDSPRTDPDLARARPYVVPAVALKDVVQISSGDNDQSDGPAEWTLVELIMSGALERDDPISGSINKASVGQDVKGKQKEVEAAGLLSAAGQYEWMERRAWIGGLSEILMESNLGASAIQTFARGGSEQRTVQQQQPLPNAAKSNEVNLPTAEKSLPPPPSPSPSERALADSKLPPRSSKTTERPPRSRPPIRLDGVVGVGSGSTSNFVPKPSGLRNRASWSDLSPDDSHIHVKPGELSFKSQLPTHRSPPSNASPSEAHGLPTPPDSEEASLECDLTTPQSSRPGKSLSAPVLAEQQISRRRGSHEKDYGREHRHGSHNNVERQRRRVRTEPDASARRQIERIEHPKPRGQSQPATSSIASKSRSGSSTPNSRVQGRKQKLSISLVSLPLSDAAAARAQVNKPSNSFVTTAMAEARLLPRAAPTRSKSAVAKEESRSAAKAEFRSEVGHERHERKPSLRREARHLSVDPPRDRSQSRTPEPARRPNPASVPPSGSSAPAKTKSTSFVQVGRAGADGAFALVPTGSSTSASRGREQGYEREHELAHKQSKWRFWKVAV